MHFKDEDRRIENLLLYMYNFLYFVRTIHKHNILLEKDKIKTIIVTVVKVTVFRT